MDAPSDLGSPGAAPPPHPPEGHQGPRRLRRRPDDGHIAGVCAGVAEYFNLDPLLVRIAAVVLLISGPGFFAYILMWIFVPAEPGVARFGEPQLPIDRKDRATQIFGIVLLGLGVSVIWGDWWAPARGWLFPLCLIALGAWLLLRPDRDDDPLPPVPPAPPVPPMPPTPASAAWGWPSASTTQPVTPPVSSTGPVPDGGAAGDMATDTDPTNADGSGATDSDIGTDTTATDVDTTTVQPTTDTGSGGAGWGSPPTGPPSAPWDVPPSPVPGDAAAPAYEDHRRRDHRHRHRALVGPGVFGVLLIWTGVAWLTGVGLTTGLAVGLVILGLGFVIGSFVGGSRALIFPALVVAAALAITAFIDIPLTGPIGEQSWSPDSRAELQDTYEVSMGEGTLDLSGLNLEGPDADVHATIGLGHLIVLVREDQDLLIDTQVGAGEVDTFGEQQNGVGFETHEAYNGEGATLTLDLEVGMGQIEIRRVDSDGRDQTVDGPEPVDSPDPTTPSTLG